MYPINAFVLLSIVKINVVKSANFSSYYQMCSNEKNTTLCVGHPYECFLPEKVNCDLLVLVQNSYHEVSKSYPIAMTPNEFGGRNLSLTIVSPFAANGSYKGWTGFTISYDVKPDNDDFYKCCRLNDYIAAEEGKIVGFPDKMGKSETFMTNIHYIDREEDENCAEKVCEIYSCTFELDETDLNRETFLLVMARERWEKDRNGHWITDGSVDWYPNNETIMYGSNGFPAFIQKRIM